MQRSYDVTVRLVDGTIRTVRVAGNIRSSARTSARHIARNESGVAVDTVLRVAYVPADAR